jgi:hypothetical protein
MAIVLGVGAIIVFQQYFHRQMAAQGPPSDPEPSAAAPAPLAEPPAADPPPVG